MDERAFGRGIKALRVRRGWRQEDLARAAGLSRGALARVEQGHGSRVTLATLVRIAAALDARVVCRLTRNGEALDRLLDAAHAALVERIVRELVSRGWHVATEVSFNHFGDRGTVDVLAFHPTTGVILVVEAKSVVPDLQAMLSALDRKARLGREIAAARGWTGRSVARLLVIEESRTARRRVAEHSATFSAAFPHRGSAVRAWLAAPNPREPLAGLWLLSSGSQAVARRGVRRRRPVTERATPPRV